jgi:hypothetical protein
MPEVALRLPVAIFPEKFCEYATASRDDLFVAALGIAGPDRKGQDHERKVFSRRD